MSKEIKLGIISLITIATMVWMFQFLKGKNILKKIATYESVYGNIEGLKMAAPVEINGYVVGGVSKIELNPENVRSMIITFDVQGDFKIPMDAIAVLAADNSLVGSKKIILDYDKACEGDDCAPDGYRLTPGSRGTLEALIGKDDLKSYLSDIRTGMGPIVDTLIYKLTSEDSENAVSKTILNLERSMSNLASLTESMDRLLKNTYADLNTTVEGMAVVSTSLANTHVDMENMIRNFSELSQQLVDADLGTALGRTGETFDKTNALLEDLQNTVAKANTSFDTINDLLSKVEDGEGSLAQLISDPAIYDNLEETTRHLALLLQDLRLNPKRYVRMSVFGRKGNEYVPPEQDPVFDKQTELDLEKNKEKKPK